MTPRNCTASARRPVGSTAVNRTTTQTVPVVRGGTVWGRHSPRRDRQPATVRTRGRRRRLVRAHWCVSLAVASSAAAFYAGFILLVLFGKPLAGRILVPGLSVELLVAVAIMTNAWLATGLYSLWFDRIGRSAARSDTPPLLAAAGPASEKGAP